MMRRHLSPRVMMRALLVLVLVPLLMSSSGLAPRPADRVAAQSPTPTIVVTTAVLGSLVRELLAERATVTVLMPNGVDPHEWQPSARDIEALHGASLVVANGLDLEAGLHDALAAVESEGVPVFRATDHVTLRHVGEGEVAAGASPGGSTDGEHAPGAADPHVWVDPVAMAGVVDALAATLAGIGIDVEDRRAALDAELASLDAEVRSILEPVPPERRRLVTGHESMGYFADRYGFSLVGAIIPGLSSQSEVSARQLADIAAAIRAQGVPAVFAEVGTPQSVIDAIAGETGVRVVTLPSHTLPDDGTYATFIRTIATSIAEALR